VRSPTDLIRVPPARIAATALAVALILPGAAGASGWTPARAVFPPGTPGVADPQVAVAPDGSALAVWGRPDFFSGPLQSATLDPGAAAWGPIQTVPGANDWLISEIHLRLDGTADAIATWTNTHTSGGGISAATRPAGGSWTGSQFISTGEFPGAHGLAVDPDGKAIVVWPANGWGGAGPTTARVRPPGSVWGPVTPISIAPVPPKTLEANPAADVALDPAGRAVAGWAQTVDGVTTVHASWRPAGGPWGAPRTVAQAAAAVRALRVGIDASGAATLVWGTDWGGGGDVYASRAPWSGTWEQAAALSSQNGGLGSRALDLAVDPGGKAVAVWTEWGRVTAAIRPAGGSWLARQTLSGDGGDGGVVALDAAGDAVAAWQRDTGGSSVVEARTRPQGGDWSAPRVLSAPATSGADPAASITPDGEALVVWAQSDDLNRGVAFAVDDATPPSIGSVSVPPAAVAGAAVAVSMSAPADRWSAVDRIGWDFGDGRSAAGAAVTHVYDAPGTYSVTARAVDAVGNATAVTRPIVVSAPPAPPAPSPPGITGTVGGVSVQLPGAAPGSTPAPATSVPRRRALTLAIAVPRTLRAGSRAIIRVRLNRPVRGALARVQLRRGVAYRTVAQGRVSGSRIPVALTFARPGRYLLRVQIVERGRATVNRVQALVVRR
jgi:hypothetical protein